ncbi:MAG: hypothetical protein ACI978_002710 [Oleispira sp.]
MYQGVSVLVFIFLVISFYICYFFVLPLINNESYRVGGKLASINVKGLNISFGPLSNVFGKTKDLKVKNGIYVSALKYWFRGPLEIMMTIPITNDEIEKAISNIENNINTLQFKKAKFIFNSDSNITIKLKKTFFYATTRFEVDNVKLDFHKALKKLQSG